MARNIIVQPLSRTPIDRCAVEMCEHKGIGHPDSIVDGVCEAASRELSKAYLDAYGRILHHNLDKGLLVAGKSAPRFSGGEVLMPIKIVLCGRATSVDEKVDPRAVAVAAAQRYLQQHIHCDPKHFEIATEINEGAANLKEIFARGEGIPVANDTSFGCGYAPYSRLERAVLKLSEVLKSPEFRHQFPAAGDDFKIMGYRMHDTVSITLALAFVDRYVKSAADYYAVKQWICEFLTKALPTPVTININALDDPKAQKEEGLYLTVTGLSGEMGDDGQAGRGNRVNGLITPNRIMSLEAAAGKNPISHVGKLYNVLAMLIARDVYEKIEGVEEVDVQLLSTIGAPIDRPAVAAIEIGMADAVTMDVRRAVAGITDAWLERIGEVTDLILDEKLTLY